MRILFYSEPKSSESGPESVAWHLSRKLSNKVDLTYFPRVKYSRSYLRLANVYGGYLFDKFDVVHYMVAPIWGNGSYLMLKSANYRKTPVIINIHGLIEVEHSLEPKVANMSKVTWATYFNACRLAKKVIVNSEFMKHTVAISLNLDPEKISIIPNGVNYKRFSKCKSKIELEGDPAIITIGRVCFMKGFGTLIDAIAKIKEELPNLRVHLIGPVTKNYVDFAKSKGVEKFIVFHGIVPHSLIPSYLKSADLGFFGSTVYEGFGVALIESMASGLPVIASDIDTYRQIVADGKDGLLYEKTNADSLAKAILTMTHQSDLRKRISVNSQEKASQYDWDKVAQQYISLYNDISVN